MFSRGRALLVVLCVTLVATAFFPSAAGAQDDDVVLRGTIRAGREVLPDVQLTAFDADGNEIGATTTAADGKWEIPITATGEYTVVLDPSTLREDVGFREGAGNEVTVLVDEFRSTAVGFQLEIGGQSLIQVDPTWQRILNRAVSGFKIGLLIALAAIGLSLIFGVTGLVNFAHSEMVAFGAVVAFGIESATGWTGAGFVAVVVVTVLIGGVLGYTLETTIFKPLRKRKMTNISLMVVSIGLAFLMRYVILIVFEADPETYESFRIQQGRDFGPISLPPKDYVIIALALIVLVVVGVLLQKTKLGTAMRAVSDNPALASSSGIDVDRTIKWVWIFGSGLASLGGIMLGLTQVVEWQMGEKILLLIFAAVTLGGLGTAYGAMVGGLAIGIISETSTFWLDNDLKFLVALAVLIFILLVRPQGILGVRERLG